MVQLFRRQVDAGTPVRTARRLLRKRNLWLLVTGMLTALMGAPFAARAPVNASFTSIFGNSAELAGIESYPESIGGRLAFWPFLVIGQGLLSVVIPVMILLAVGWSFGLVHALEHLGVFSVPDQVFWVFLATQSTSGLFGGLGYVALFGLLGHRVAARRATPGLGVVAVTAVGKRSLWCYLAQSVICAPALAAWGLGLGGVFGSAAVALFAVGVWLLTLVLAYAQERAGRRGPAEVLLRRLVYPRRSSRSSAAG